jgi:hypothetical protein
MTHGAAAISLRAGYEAPERSAQGRLAILLRSPSWRRSRSSCRTYGVCIPAMTFHPKGSGVPRARDRVA